MHAVLLHEHPDVQHVHFIMRGGTLKVLLCRGLLRFSPSRILLPRNLLSYLRKLRHRAREGQLGEPDPFE